MAATKVRSKPTRVRDPVYDIYRFEDEIDQVALELIDTPAFQRLRRIKQLGFSDYVYPGASHTRFAHSLGVYATARKLIRVIERHEGSKLDPFHACIAALGALLHDIGHGPFSHAFEATQAARGIKKRHEEWSADIIREEAIRSILSGKKVKDALGRSAEDRAPELADAIAILLESDEPKQYYEAIVSSSFDADRLDYVQRDRIMSGTGTGAIDFAWLMEHVRFDKIKLMNKDIGLFSLHPKAVQQAEIFLLARYHLYDQVYFHKVNRGMECLLAACLVQLCEFTKMNKSEDVGLPENNLLVQFLQSGSVQDYLRIDDTVVMAAVQQLGVAPPLPQYPHETLEQRRKREMAAHIKDLAERIVNRVKPHCLELEKLAGTRDRYEALRDQALAYMEAVFPDGHVKAAFFDKPNLSIYGQAKGGVIKTHKRLWIHQAAGPPIEITNLSKSVESLVPIVTREIGRIYFLHEADYKKAVKDLSALMKGK